MSHFRLDSPYSLYSELPEHHRPETRPPQNSITRQSDRRFTSSINPLAHAIKIRDIVTSSTIYKNNNYSNSSMPNIDSISITETGAGGDNNDDALYKNNTTSANLTDSNYFNRTPILNRPVPYSNKTTSNTPDKESTQPKERHPKDNSIPVNITQNDSSAGQNDTSFVFGNKTAMTNRSVEAPSRIYLPSKFDPLVNKSVKIPSRTYLPSKLNRGNISMKTPSRDYLTSKSKIKNEAIEVFQSISTEYQTLVDNNAFKSTGSGRYGPSRSNAHKKRNEGKGSGWKNNKYSDDDEHQDYRNKTQQWQRKKGSASRVRGISRGAVKRNKDYFLQPQGSSPVAKVIEFETNGAPVAIMNGFHWLAGSPFKLPPPSNESTEVYRTIGSSIVTAGLQNSSIIETIPSEGFEITSTASVEQIRSEEFKPTMAASSTAVPIKKIRTFVNGKATSRGAGVKRNRGGKKYKSIEKSNEDRSVAESDDSTNMYKGGTASYIGEKGKGTLGIPTTKLDTDEVLILNAFNIGGFVSYNVSQVEE